MRLGRRSLSAALLASLLAAGLTAQDPLFRRGDSNGDARLDLSDAVHGLHYLFQGGSPPGCADAADSNDDGAIDISDSLYTLLHLFLGGTQPPAPGLVCGSDPTADELDCLGYAACEIGTGPSDFTTPLAGGPAAGPGRAEDDGAMGGAPPPGPPAGQGGTPERLVEESDIYKIEGSNLFILNRYRGLQVVDISNLDAPRIIGSAPIFGYPREMYVRGSTAYIIVSDYYSFWRDETASDFAPHAFYGSQLRIVDISNLTSPVVVGGIDLAGDCTDSRIVGEVMYLVSHRYPWYSHLGSTDTEDKTQVLSVSIGNPADVKVIDTEDFPRNGWEHHIYVTPNTIYLASSGYTGGRFDGYETRIRYIDISDPRGTIVIRDEALVSGRVQDRWAMDEYAGALRVASGASWGNGDVFLTTWSVANPDDIRSIGSYTLHVNERLTAARFDGTRAYLVTYMNIDPLFAFDLSDPSRPRLLGELEMTGWLDFIVPSGDGRRLVALGHEDITNPQGGREISLAVSLIDVAGDTAPKLLSRVALDGLWGWVPGSRDDFAKVFRTLPDQGLILFPFQAWDPTSYRSVGGVQLIDYDETKLTKRGLIEDAGWVERGIPHDPATVLTLSSEYLQVVDITDRDAPDLRAKLELARNVQQLALLTGEHTVQLVGDWYRGDTELIVTTTADPDAAEPLARVHVPSPYGRLFVNGDIAYVSSVQREDPANPESPVITRVQVVDLSDPASPVLRGSVDLPETVWTGYGMWYWGWGDEVVQVNGSTLAFHRYPYGFRYYDCLACAGPGGLDAVAPPVEPVLPDHTIYIVDLADPDVPEVADTVEIEGADWAWGLKASGTTLYLSFYRAFIDDQSQWMAKYFLSRIDVSDPANALVLPEVNIPGMFIDALPGSPFIYTLESFWEYTTQKSRTLFHALAIVDDKAVLQSSVELEGYANGVQVKDGAGVAVVYSYEMIPVEGGFQYVQHQDLVTIDLADAAAIRVAGKAALPQTWAYLQKVEGGRAFLGSGPGIFTYLVSDLSSPTFESFHRTQGWSQDIVVRDDRAYVPSGYYGVQVLELGAPTP